jgi:Raf kinase inhibitor-like YbhB/YbcL family protein
MRLLKYLFTVVVAIALTSFTRVTQLTVTSASFKNNGDIPSKYSCEGAEVSPPLQISGIPANAKSLAIILHDPDAPMEGGFTHWVVWNIEPANNKIAENFKGADQGFNGLNKTGYKGMCPPSGTHHYHFMVYALDAKLTLDKSTNKALLEKSMQGHVVAQGELVGLYKKTKQ